MCGKRSKYYDRFNEHQAEIKHLLKLKKKAHEAVLIAPDSHMTLSHIKPQKEVSNKTQEFKNQLDPLRKTA